MLRRRRGKAGAHGAVLSAAILLAVWPAISAGAQSATETYRDNFDAVSFSGNNGNAAWSGDWIEAGESDGPTAGRVRVVIQSECVSGGCGRLTANGNTDVALQREADLNGASGASLSFDYRRSKGGGSAGLVHVAVSPNGGSSWSTLESFALDTDDDGPLSRSYPISSFASTATRVRFRVVSSPGENGAFHFDNVRVVATFPPPPTTTTSTTVTSLPPTTSTTTPPTTTQAPPSTTSGPPPATTAPPPTTSGPPSPTTTTPPPLPTTTSPGSTAPPTSAPVATSTSPVAAPPLPFPGEPARPLFPVVLPPDPVELTPATPVEPRRLVATDRDLSSLVLHPLAEFVSSRLLPRKVVESPPNDAVGGAVAGVRSAVLTAWPLGAATMGFFVTRLAALRRRRENR